MWGHAQGVAPAELSPRVGLEADEVEAAYREIERRGSRPSTCTPRRSSSEPGLTDRVRDRGHRAAGGRAAGRRERAAADGARDPPSRARTASGWRSTRGAGLVSTRLAIFDLPGGWQPIEAAAGRRPARLQRRGLQPPELRDELEARGESLRDHAATPRSCCGCSSARAWSALERLNGQFAFAWWQPERAPPDAGPRPLRRAPAPLRAARRRHARLRVRGEGAVRLGRGRRRARTSPASTTCSRSGGRGLREPPSRGVSQLPPGRPAGLGARADRRAAPVVGARLRQPDGAATADLRGPAAGQRPAAAARRRAGRRLPLRRARLEPDRALAQAENGTASCAPSRSPSRTRATTSAPTRRRSRGRSAPHHHVVEAGPAEIAEAFPEVVRHAETPLVRTAPVPLFLLAREVRANEITVVITGEGADELFWGYDLFKEVALAGAAPKRPRASPGAARRLLPVPGPGGARRGPAWQRFLLETGSSDDPLRSHLTRAAATATVKAFYRPEVAAEIGDGASLDAAPRRAAGGVRSLEHARASGAGSSWPPCSSPTCLPPRATAWRWRTGWRGGFRSSTTACSRMRRRCRLTAS